MSERTTPTFDTTIDRPEIGQWETLTVTCETADGKPNPMGSPGSYTVTFVLGFAAVQVADAGVSFETSEFSAQVVTEGDSFLQFWIPGVVGMQTFGATLNATIPDGNSAQCTVKTNRSGRMAQVLCDNILADNFDEAEGFAYRVFLPILGWLSLQYSIPMGIIRIVSKELSTYTIRTTAFLNPKIRTLDGKFSPPAGIPTELYECAGNFLQAQGTANDFYRALCLFKVCEGLVQVRQKIDREARKQRVNVRPPRPSRKKIPAALATDCGFPELGGKPLERARDVLRSYARNRIAHVDFATGTFISMHTLDDLKLVRRIGAVMQYVARELTLSEVSAAEEFVRLTGKTLPMSESELPLLK